MEEKEKKEGFYRYFALYTEYGPLYLYEKYENDPDRAGPFGKEMPVTREFFTGEEAKRGYHTLDFLDRTAKFKTEEMNMEGYPYEYYFYQLQPYEFLEKVEPFMETEETKKDKARKVYDILNYKAKNIGNTSVIKEPPKVSEQTKNKFAKKLLKEFTI